MTMGRTGPRRYPRAGLAVLLLALTGGCDVPTALPRFENTLVLPAPDMNVPVLGAPAAATVSVDLANVDEAFADRVRGGEVQFTPVNPSGATGTLTITISEPQSGASVSGTIDVASQTPQIITIPEQTMRAFLGRTVDVTASGTLGPLTLPNPASVRLETLMRVTFEVGGEG